MRIILALIFAFISFAAQAVEAPPGQIHIAADQILRGQFVQTHQAGAAVNPVTSSGHFTVAPQRGLIWGIEQPFPTSTIITPNGAVQDIGGLVMKLPAKNLRHIYDMVGGALLGDWNKLAEDFILTPGGDARHWHMLLTPRQGGKPKLSYTAITVSGSRFVENIVMTKPDGGADSFSFTGAVLSPAPLAATEAAAFNEVR